MTTDDSDDRAHTEAQVNWLEVLANLTTAVGAVVSVVNFIKGGRLPLTITALAFFVVAVLLGGATFALIWFKGLRLRLPRATVVVLVVAFAGAVGATAWLAKPENKEVAAADSDTSTGGGSRQPVPGPVTTTPITPPPTTPHKAGCQRLQTTAPIRPASKVSTTSVRLVEATYTLFPTEFPGLAEAGRVEGRPAAGDVLYLVGTADPSTRDSNPEHKSGTPNYFFLTPITLDGQGCWTVERRQVGYDCAGGLTFAHSLALLHAADAQNLVSQQKSDPNLRDNGFSENEFGKLPVSLLQTFEIDTTPAACTQP